MTARNVLVVGAGAKRELRIFTPDEGGAEHIGLDHLPHVSAFIADWVTDTFAEPAPLAGPVSQPGRRGTGRGIPRR